MDDIFVDDLVDAVEPGKYFLKNGKFPELPLALPGLDPTDREAGVSAGGLQYFAPGLREGQTAEWRETLGTFDNNREPDTLNSCIFRGWNYGAGASQINAAYGSIGSGEEFAYQPPGRTETWSESHPLRFTPPGGGERRIFSGYGYWETGQTWLACTATEGVLQYQPIVGPLVNLISWGSESISVGGNGFYFPQSGRGYLQQLNANANAFLSLPYAGSEDEIIAGHDPLINNIPPLRTRDIHLMPVAAADVIAPTSGVKLFWDATSDSLSAKNAAGTVFKYSGSRRL